MNRHTLLIPLLFAAACADMTTTTPAATPAVPPALVGEWDGTWAATGTEAAGALTLRVQEFAGEPVVQIDTDLPCVAGTTFRLDFTATSFTASIGDQQVLRGEVAADGTLSGTYACAAGEGAWQAARVRTLPAIVDLSGGWTGALYREGATPQPFTLDLQMTLDAGVLRLAGSITVQGEPTDTIAGYAAEFDDAGYQVFFESSGGVLRAQGNGLYGPLRVETGQWGVFASGTPIGGGVFAMERQAP